MTSHREFLEFHEERQAEGQRRVREKGFVPDAILADELLGRGTDERYGVNVIARPPGVVVAAIQGIQAELREIDGAQYFYPADDLHLTVMEILQGRAQPAESADVERIWDAVALVCATTSAPRLMDGRVAFDENAVMLSCFPPDNGLDAFRERLSASLEESLIATNPRFDHRTAHLTFVRYLCHVRSPTAWSDYLRGWQGTALPMSWEIEKVYVTAGATWYGRPDRIEERGPLSMIRPSGDAAIS